MLILSILIFWVLNISIINAWDFDELDSLLNMSEQSECSIVDDKMKIYPIYKWKIDNLFMQLLKKERNLKNEFYVKIDKLTEKNLKKINKVKQKKLYTIFAYLKCENDSILGDNESTLIIEDLLTGKEKQEIKKQETNIKPPVKIVTTQPVNNKSNIWATQTHVNWDTNEVAKNLTNNIVTNYVANWGYIYTGASWGWANWGGPRTKKSATEIVNGKIAYLSKISLSFNHTNGPKDTTFLDYSRKLREFKSNYFAEKRKWYSEALVSKTEEEVLKPLPGEKSFYTLAEYHKQRNLVIKNHQLPQNNAKDLMRISELTIRTLKFNALREERRRVRNFENNIKNKINNEYIKDYPQIELDRIHWPDISEKIIASDTHEVRKTNVRKTNQIVSYTVWGLKDYHNTITDDAYYKSWLDGNYEIDKNIGIVTDNITGLMWDDKDWPTQRWRQAMDWYKAKEHCENYDLAGYTDWRLPTATEMVTIADYGTNSPAINRNVFQSYAQNGRYWTSDTKKIWNNRFTVFAYIGDTGNISKRTTNVKSYTRCVRGTEKDSNFKKKNWVIYDNKTELYWQDEYTNNTVALHKYIDTFTYCDNLELDWKTDWRLPNILELFSIMRYSENNKVDNIFKNINNEYKYMTSTSLHRYNQHNLYVDFKEWTSGSCPKAWNKQYAVRCVR